MPRGDAPSSSQGLRKACDEHGPAAGARRGPVRLWPHRQAAARMSITASTPDIVAVGQGHRRRLPARRLPRDREGGGKGMVIGTHGSTYGGNPLAMAAGEAVLDVIARARLPRACRARWASGCAQALEQMIPNHDHLFESVRGKGLMLGIKLKIRQRRALRRASARQSRRC